MHARQGFDPGAIGNDWHLLRDGPHSRILEHRQAPAAVVKLIEPRSKPRDWLRKYGLSQARREHVGSTILAELGLPTPEIYGWGVTLAPTARYESILFMEQLQNFTSGLAVIRQERDAVRRRQFLELVAAGVAKIYGNGYLHKDCHFENVCWLDHGPLVWIDNDVRRSRDLSASRTGLTKTLRLLKNTARNDLSNTEWQGFRQHLYGKLATQPLGVRLADEIR
ncbi:hypothetical protein J7355_06100 [Endozoicomonas sp. G2_2]|uniref:lipopolysaccharide kinase InaA family protein n=1 Tax=Endozoicomonas sp. G2_2 TaxID=2821092 RepID=UPI001ADAD238|nr:lipopolysaccharide kinase InaA family protein [Endozoicomonas sp. G2_2]MBO9469664.1 hypothetical protein [Endozoicomonas sp. G2_2]